MQVQKKFNYSFQIARQKNSSVKNDDFFSFDKVRVSTFENQLKSASL